MKAFFFGETRLSSSEVDVDVDVDVDILSPTISATASPDQDQLSDLRIVTHSTKLPHSHFQRETELLLEDPSLNLESYPMGNVDPDVKESGYRNTPG